MKPSTNSKMHFPAIAKAAGKYCWDIDGNKYLDFTGANLTTVLGFRPRKAVVPNFPGVSSAEEELTSLLKKHTGFNHYRFFPSGSDAVSCAIRLARYTLGYDALIGYMGYAGSHNEYAWTINKKGIPKQNSVQQRNGFWNSIPEIIVSESRFMINKPPANFTVCDCLKDGILVLHKKLPPADLYCFGKSVFNGSAGAILTGNSKHMKLIDNIYFSTTFGCNNDMMTEAIRTINDFEKVKDKYFNLYNYAKKVLPPWFSATPDQIKEFARNGVLFNGYWSCHIQHTKKDIDKLKKLIDSIL